MRTEPSWRSCQLSVSTVVPYGTSSCVCRKICSRTISAASSRSGRSVRSSSGYRCGPSGIAAASASSSAVQPVAGRGTDHEGLPRTAPARSASRSAAAARRPVTRSTLFSTSQCPPRLARQPLGDRAHVLGQRRPSHRPAAAPGRRPARRSRRRRPSRGPACGAARKMPGVSTSRIWPAPRIRMPSTRNRVVCAFGVTIDSFAPVSRFSSVDLPAFGAPTMAAKPQREVTPSCLAAGAAGRPPPAARPRACCRPCRAAAWPAAPRPPTRTPARAAARRAPTSVVDRQLPARAPAAHSCSAVLASFGGSACARHRAVPGAADEARAPAPARRRDTARRAPPPARRPARSRAAARRPAPRRARPTSTSPSPISLGDLGQHRLRHQMRQPRAELAFLLVRETARPATRPSAGPAPGRR